MTESYQPRSCNACRSRKIKCDRQRPCANCLRSGSDCINPPGRGRAPKRSRQAANAQLVDRLSRLESIVQRIQHDNLGDVVAGTQPSSTDVLGHCEPTSSQRATAPIDQQLGHLMINESRSYYVSNVLWASLSNEIEELRDMTNQSTTDEDCPPAPTPSDMSISSACMAETPSQLGTNGAIFGFQSVAQSLQSLHPPLSPSVSLLRVFTENVAPLVRIFHMPTTSRIYWDAIASLDSPLDKNIEALLFAIYYSAVISMDEPNQCLNILGIPRDQALKKYRFAVEQALARADLLNTQSITLLQATVLFLYVLRSADNSRTAWSLTALVFHIARAMGLHRDGTAFGLNPFDTEIRRRLWYHICLLDNRSSEHNGCEPIVPGEFAFDTRLPLLINDSDLTPDMISPPPERDELCDMTFCLMRCEAMALDFKTNYLPPGSMSRFQARSSDRPSREDRQRLVEELRARLQDRYIRYCDPSSTFGLFTSTVARLILSHVSFSASCPLDRKSASGKSSVRDYEISARNHLFQTSTDILELSSLILTNESFARWRWHSRTHVQWHAVAFVLSEICLRPPGPDCDRAWTVVSTVCENWATSKAEHEKNTNMVWRPIKRLLAKARYVRGQQQRNIQQTVPLDPHNKVNASQNTSMFSPLGTISNNSTFGEVDFNQSIPGMDWDLSLDLLSDTLYPWNFPTSPIFHGTDG